MNQQSQPSCRGLLARGSLEISCLIILILPMAYIYIFPIPFKAFQRGFYCNDENLKHPFSDQTIQSVECTIIWAAASALLILAIEILRRAAEQEHWASLGYHKPSPGRFTPWIAVEIFRHFGYFTLGALTTLLFTELAKYTIGRLRPHFLTLCQPDYSESGLCKDEFGYPRFVIEDEEQVCLGLTSNGGNTSTKDLHNARLSFLSGHSSFSFYCATFLIVYLQASLSNFPRSNKPTIRILYRTLKVLRPFIQFAIITLAFWIALTRISNYYHHPFDVVTGALVGIVFASITLLVIADLFNKKSAFWRSMEMEGDRQNVSSESA